MLKRRTFLRSFPFLPVPFSYLIGHAAYQKEFPSLKAAQALWQEPPFSELQEWLTPSTRFFVRHHLGIPEVDADRWTLSIEGSVDRRLELGYEQLLKLPTVSQVYTVECAGNLPGGGMVGNAEWTGVRLGDLLQEAGVQEGAVEIIMEGDDVGIDEGENIPVRYARSIPLSKALAPETLLAFQMNGETLARQHGFPVRAVVPGWYGMSHVKWLRRIEVSDRPFTGFYMSKRYFTARRDEITGEFLISPVRQMKIKSQIARPREGELLAAAAYTIRGAAWTGDGKIARVEISLDGGLTWNKAELEDQGVPFAWRLWRCDWSSPPIGRHTLTVRAFDEEGKTQPVEEDRQQTNRYANHWRHRVNVEVVAAAVPK